MVDELKKKKQKEMDKVTVGLIPCRIITVYFSYFVSVVGCGIT